MSAFTTLHERNHAAALAVARGLARSAVDAEDLVAEGMTKVMEAIQRGNGPDDSFRPYLLTVIRHLAYDTSSRRQREEVVPDAGEDLVIDLDDPAILHLEREMVRHAFATLPERWQTVLWETEVEGRRPQDIAPALGLSANAAAALTYRAREGLRHAYLAVHQRGNAEARCGRPLDQLPAYVRGTLGSRGERSVAKHLETCDRCLAAYLELVEINSDLRVAFPPWFLAGGAAAISAGLSGSLIGATHGEGGPGGSAARSGLRHGLAQSKRGLAWGVVATTAAALAVGLVLGARLDHPQAPQALIAQPVSSETVPASSTSARSSAPVRTGPEDGPRPTDGAAPHGTEPSVPTGPATPAIPRDGGGGGGGGDAIPHGPFGPAIPGTPMTTPPPSTAPSSADPTVPPPSAPAPSTPSAPSVPGPTQPSPTVPATTTPGTTPGTTTPGTTTPGPTVPASGTTVPATPTTVPPTTVPPTTSGPAVTEPATTTTTMPTTTTTPQVPITVTAVPVGSLAAGDEGTVALRVSGLPAGPNAGSMRVTAAGATLAPAPGDAGCTQDGPAVVCDLSTRTRPGAVTHFLRITPATSGTVPLHLTFDGAAVRPADRNRTVTLPVDGGPLSSVFTREGRFGLASAGTNVVTCDASEPGCTAAQQRQGHALENNDWSMVHVDVDGASGLGALTFDSASASLDVPGTPVAAFAIWGGSLEAGDGGDDAPAPSEAGKVVLHGPAGDVAVTADRLQTGSSLGQYQAVADVSAYVTGSGSYTVSNVQASTGRRAFGGWQLVVVYADDALPIRVASVLVGLHQAPADGAPVEVPLGGFAPVGGAEVILTGWEGDAGLTSETARAWGTSLSDAANPLGDLANSTVFTRPGVNTFGLDIDRFVLPTVADADDRSLVLTGGADDWSYGVVATLSDGD